MRRKLRKEPEAKTIKVLLADPPSIPIPRENIFYRWILFHEDCLFSNLQEM
jgi:hypothetical protein